MSTTALLNKFDLFHVVLNSALSAPDKTLLISLILHTGVDTGESWPSVERLCRARGIDNEKNFKGVARYLPDLVTVTRRGRRGNLYTLCVPAIQSLPQAPVVLKHTPRLVPAVEAKVPALQDLVPAVEAEALDSAGANSTRHITRNNTQNTTETDLKGSHVSALINEGPPTAVAAADAPPLDVTLPVPGDIRALVPMTEGRALGANESGGRISGTSGDPQVQEAVRESPEARLDKLLLKRRIEKWVKDEEEQQRVLEKALELRANGASERGDDLVHAAYGVLCEW